MYTSKKRRRTKGIEMCCSAAEKRYIEICAQKAGLSSSSYIRKLALKDSPEVRKTLPPEVLALNGELAGIAGSLDIISRKRLDNEDLDSLERAELQFRAKEVKALTEKIKSYLL